MKKNVLMVFLSGALIFAGVSSALGQTHVEKARALDEYISRQYRASQSALPKPKENHSQDRLKNSIAAGFRYYNRRLSQAESIEYAGYVIDSCRKFQVDDPALVAAMIVKESRVNPRAKSRYAHGLMQIYWKVHKKSIASAFPYIKTLENLLVPKNNIMVGTWIFSNYLRQTGGDVHKALHKYLGRKGNRYVTKIMAYRTVMRKGL